jgi:hypothetical protein
MKREGPGSVPESSRNTLRNGLKKYVCGLDCGLAIFGLFR